ncbi:MAG TPA: hypothetical protein VJS89_00930 [Gammaproteobacteria bacterium]|nr:hypothetical protein [Gammaproteobacteria bacterium]
MSISLAAALVFAAEAMEANSMTQAAVVTTLPAARTRRVRVFIENYLLDEERPGRVARRSQRSSLGTAEKRRAGHVSGVVPEQVLVAARASKTWNPRLAIAKMARIALTRALSVAIGPAHAQADCCAGPFQL